MLLMVEKGYGGRICYVIDLQKLTINTWKIMIKK